ncbi:O-methyltransferase [Streptomyces anulatus]|uniref:O-methyltransferase n=1 Tax=Streptomyces anulatus TaxID=1892 RepID=UPI000A446F4F|nr:class I SAM-dependent methyltransferase [Streptomyces anulatus]
MTTHTHTLAEPRLRSALTRMFEAATRDDEAAARVRSLRPHDRGALTAQELADANREIYMPISADGGKLLYNLVRATRPANVVEFGTSYGISTLHLAAAVRDNGSGHVITTEMNTAKAAAARDTFTATGLDDVITLLRETPCRRSPHHAGPSTSCSWTGGRTSACPSYDSWSLT